MDILVQAHLILLALLYCASQILCFLQIEGKTLHQQKDYNSFYQNTHFIAFLTLFWYLLCSGGLEWNLQYLQSMPVFAAESTIK